MKLLLTSAGLSCLKIKDAFLELLEKEPTEAKILFVTTASNPELNKDYLEVNLQNIKSCNVKNIEFMDFSKETLISITQKLNNCDAIYMEGGNTFYLMYKLKEAGIVDILRDLVITQNKLYIGSSAGSIVATPCIEVASLEPADPNDVGLFDFEGLDFVDFEVSPHTFDLVSLDKVREYFNKNRRKIYALDDKSAIKFTYSGIEVISEGKSELIS